MGAPADQAASAPTTGYSVQRRGFARRLRVWLALVNTRWLEEVGVVVAAALATLYVEWRIVSDPLVFQTDAQIHEFWMRRFQDDGLFHDPLTTALLGTGYQPDGFHFIYWLASHVVDPVLFGELLPLVLQPLAVWLVFRIVREQASWRPAAWIGGALFLVAWDIHRFSGGHPRAFAQPIVLLTVFLLLRRRNAAAALIPPLGALLYPPASVVALAVLLLAALDRGRRLFLNRTRAAWAAAGAVSFAAVTLVTQGLSGSQDLITADEAHRFAEFGPNGQMHFFADSTLDYLKQNYSGFLLKSAGSLLAVSAVLLLLLRPRNAALVRWEVWCMPIAALGLFGAAHAVLFRLYLPHRYTYSLLPFFCIVVAVVLRPTLEAWMQRTRVLLAAAAVLPIAFAFVALSVFPLGPQRSLSGFGSWLVEAGEYLAAGLAVGLLAAVVLARKVRERPMAGAAAASALVVGSLLVAETTFAGGGRNSADTTCRNPGLYGYLRTLPEDTIVAANPRDVNCIPIAARRAVVISRKLYQPWERRYFRIIRQRMFDAVAAFYGPSVDDIVALRTRYGADYLLVDAVRERPWPGMAPFTGEVRHLIRTVRLPAVQQLPSVCRTWQSPKFEIYSLACIGTESAR
jgi:hypothetical protein